MRNVFKLTLIAICLISCSFQEPVREIVAETEFQLPSDAIPIIYRKHIYIEGIVDKSKSIFVFDTGADNLYFDSLFFSNNKFAYDKIATAFLPGVGSKPQKTKLILDTVSFQFANNIYKTSTVPILGLKNILGDFADGILGRNYFASKVLEVNYNYQYMKIHDSINAAITNGYTKIRCENVNSWLYVPIKLRINDSLEIIGNYTLDLGSGGSISLTSPTAKQFDLGSKINHKRNYHSKYGGVGGETSRYDFIAKSVFIGDYELKDFVMDYSEDKSGVLSTSKNLGLLGNKILEKFDLIIDFRNSFLYIKPNSSFDNPFKIPRLGFAYVDRTVTLGAWNITGFYEGSSAERSGLKIDDKITQLNDQPIDEINYERQQEIFKQAETIKLTVKRNNETLFFNIQLKEIL